MHLLQRLGRRHGMMRLWQVFPPVPPWLDSPLTVTVEELDQAGEIKQRSLDLMNFFSLAIFEYHKDHLLEKRNELIRSGKAILNEKESFFPSLIFCGKTPQQLNSWSAGHTILDQVKDSLTVLNRFCEVWGEKAYPAYSHDALKELGLSHKVSGESNTVLTNPRLRAEREFWLPTGRKKFFKIMSN